MEKNIDVTLPEYVRKVVVKDARGCSKTLLLPKGLDLDRPKRIRTSFTQSQLDALETAFQNGQYLIGKQRTQLAKQLGLSETQVKVWYQNRRTKFRKESTSSEKVKQTPSKRVEQTATDQAKRLSDFNFSWYDYHHQQQRPYYPNLAQPEVPYPAFPLQYFGYMSHFPCHSAQIVPTTSGFQGPSQFQETRRGDN